MFNTPKFKTGDKVMVLDVNTYTKKEYVGRVGTISGIWFSYKNSSLESTYYYTIDFDNVKNESECRWYESELKPVLKESEENNMNTMPKLETGMFVIVEDTNYPCERSIGVIVNDRILYSNGDFDPADYTNWDTQYIRYILKCKYGFNFIKDKIDEIYNNDSFVCYGIEIIWKYEEPILEVTMDDIYKKFGCKVKIVSETT